MVGKRERDKENGKGDKRKSDRKIVGRRGGEIRKKKRERKSGKEREG